MLIFFQELCLLLFLWLLKLVDGLMEIFSAIAGVTDVTYRGERVNIIEFLAGDNTVNTIFWCIFILAISKSQSHIRTRKKSMPEIWSRTLSSVSLSSSS